MKIISYSLGELQANCYILVEDKNCILIDPADDGSFLLEELSRRNLHLSAMIATHGHFDHVMAVGEIQTAFQKEEMQRAPSLPVLYIHKKDSFLLKRLSQTAKYFLGYDPVIIQPKHITFLNNEKSLEIENFTFQIIHTPGHTPGGLSFYFPEEGAIFTGDTLFKESVGRIDLSYSNASDMNQSLQKLLSLPEETIVYPGHGDETSVLEAKDVKI